MFDTWKLREIFLDGAWMMNVMEKILENLIKNRKKTWSN